MLMRIRMDGKHLVCVPHAKDWKIIPKKYRTHDNYEMFCYLRYMGMDALSITLEKIREYEALEKKKNNKFLLSSAG
jgi:hypothetical protein